MKLYNKIRALLNGKRKYIAIRSRFGDLDIRVFYSPSIEHAKSRFTKGEKGEWSVFLLKDFLKNHIPKY